MTDLKWGVELVELQNDSDADLRYCRYIYEALCQCGQIVRLKTQADESPEYYTEVYIECSRCGKDVKFSLPVN